MKYLGINSKVKDAYSECHETLLKENDNTRNRKSLFMIKMQRADELSQWVKAFAVQTWQPEFDPRTPG